MAKDNDKEYLQSEETCLIDENDTTEKQKLKRKYTTASKCRRTVVFVSCIVQIIICSGVGYGLSVMYAELVIVFNAKRAEAAVIQSLFMGLSGVSGIIFTGMIHKFGPGACIMFGGLVGCIGMFVCAFARGLILIILCTGIVAGTAFGLCYLAAFVTVGWMFKNSASFFLICLMAGISIGQFILPLLFESFISQYSWSGAFILVSAVSLNCIPGGLTIHYSDKFFINTKEMSGTKSNANCDVNFLKDIVMWIILVNCLLISMTVNVEAWFIVDHMVTRGFTRESGSVLVSTMGIGSLMGRVSGALLRLYCKCPTFYHWVYLCVIIGGLHAVIINLNNFWALVAACIAYGITFATTGSQIPAIMFESVGLERYPQAMGMANLLCGVGELIGPFLGGYIYDIFGVYDTAFYAASAISAYISLATLFAAVLVRRRNLRETRTKVDTKVKYKTIK
ncbi:monocarboxylate transporter 13-like [Mercenaria mercenaria]|uniref:monocarboxylate transporter 13-like n=1 Tax=Mercenaria mercenaria TaxID=6596 RepID=UPI00234F1E5B|nr:monocarboxylate transporter 13-like [Mercenaria mercenaria]